jgi:hypothetical protein
VTVRGSLTPRAIDALVAQQPARLVVDGGPGLAIVTSDGWRTLGVWIDPWKHDALERALERTWWDAARERSEREAERKPAAIARRRASDRELHAHLFVAWKRIERPLAGVLVAASIAIVWGDGLWSHVRAAGSVLLLVGAVDWLVRRWYRRVAERVDA